MDDVILVLNSGSSSIKYSVFLECAGQIRLKSRGQIEGLYTSPFFVAKDARGTETATHSWGAGTKLGHESAIAYLTEFLSSQREDNRMIAVGHRVVHGGLEFTQPVEVSPHVLAKLERLIPLAPLHQPHNLMPIRAIIRRRPELPQIACFDTASSMAYPTSTLPACCLATNRRPPPDGSWSRTWGTARACAHYVRAKAWRQPWASRWQMAYRWARAAARSIPVCLCI